VAFKFVLKIGMLMGHLEQLNCFHGAIEDDCVVYYKECFLVNMIRAYFASLYSKAVNQTLG
jgi:hypothetical protein